MRRLLRWGQPLVERIVRGNIIVATHNVTSPIPPPRIIDIVRNITGSCEYPAAGTCTATSEYEVQGVGFTVPYTILWSVGAGATITAGQGTHVITVTTTGNTNTTYDVICTVTDAGGTDTLTKSFTDTRTAEPVYWFAGSNSGFASRSTDNGVTFTAMLKGLNSGNTTSTINGIAANGSVVIAVMNQGWCSRSTDNGATWTALPRGLNTDNVSENFTSVSHNGNTWIAVGSTGRASRSTDNGVTWTALPNGLGTGRAVATRIANNGSVWVASVSSGLTFGRSTDDGATWNTVSQPTNSTWSGFAQSGNTFIAVASTGTAVVSNDNGATWNAITIGGTGAQNPNVAGHNDTFVAAFGPGGAFRSTDGGVNWSTINNTNLCGSTLHSGARASASTWFMSGTAPGENFFSTDSGSTWTRFNPNGMNSGNANALMASFATSAP